MSRLFDDALTEYLEMNQAVLAGAPLAMVCFFKSDAEVHQTLMGLSDKDVEDHYLVIHAYDDRSKIWGYAYGGFGNEAIPATTSGWSLNTWHHICYIYAAVNDHRSFIDGGSKGINSTSVTPANLDATFIGRRTRATPGYYMSGMIAEVAIWDLTNWPGATASDKADNFEAALSNLANGYSPSFYPTGLKAHWRLKDSKLIDETETYTLIASGTSISSDHPDMILNFAGTLAAVSVVSGSLEFAAINFIGSVVEVSGANGEIEIATKLRGVSAGVSGANGKIEITTKLYGVSAGVSGVNGYIKIATKLRGSIVGISTCSGILSISISGISVAVSNTFATINILTGLGSSIVEISGAGGVLGEIEIATKLRGSIAGVFDSFAFLDRQPKLKGLTNGVLSISGSLNMLRGLQALEGAFVAESDLTSYLSLIPDFEATTLFWRPQGTIIETLEWRTSILKSRDGDEQRIKIRQTPRQYFKLQLLFETNKLNTWYDSIIHTWQKSAWLLPVWTEYVEHNIDINIKDNTIEVDTTFADFRDGGKALIWKSSTEYEIVVIDTKTDNQLNLSYSMLNSFTGYKYIVPVRTAYMTSSSSKGITNSPVSMVNLIFAIYDNAKIEGHILDPIYDGFEILDTPAFMDDIHLESSDGDMLTIDFETGAFRTESHSDFNILSQNHNFFNDSKESCWTFRRFLHSLNGRQKTILIPTFRNDVTQTDDIEATDTSVKIENINLTKNMGFNSLRDYIGFYFSDRTLIVRKITAISKVGSDEQITFNANLGLDYPLVLGDCKICFVDKCRLASDRIQIRWSYAHRNECRTNFVRVK